MFLKLSFIWFLSLAAPIHCSGVIFLSCTLNPPWLKVNAWEAIKSWVFLWTFWCFCFLSADFSWPFNGDFGCLGGDLIGDFIGEVLVVISKLFLLIIMFSLSPWANKGTVCYLIYEMRLTGVCFWGLGSWECLLFCITLLFWENDWSLRTSTNLR